MRINQFITILALLCIAIGARAKKKQDYPCAEIKVGYNYYYKFLRGEDGVIEKDTPFILLANRNHSKFYRPSTEFKDSLERHLRDVQKPSRCLMLRQPLMFKVETAALWTVWSITHGCMFLKIMLNALLPPTIKPEWVNMDITKSHSLKLNG